MLLRAQMDSGQLHMCFLLTSMCVHLHTPGLTFRVLGTVLHAQLAVPSVVTPITTALTVQHPLCTREQSGCC